MEKQPDERHERPEDLAALARAFLDLWETQGAYLAPPQPPQTAAGAESRR